MHFLLLVNELNGFFCIMNTPFGYIRKDVLLIGLGVILVGVCLKSGLEFVGVNPL